VDELEGLLARVRPVDERARAAANAAFDAKTKPRGSLGRIEELAARLAAVRGEVPTALEPAIVVAAADHGVAAEGVSAYPQEVTAQMLANFASGGAAVNVLAREAGARLVVVDAGVAVPFEHPSVLSRRLGAGTANFAEGPAMSEETAVRGLLDGAALAAELARDGIGVVALGEMGIGNTTAAAALAAAFLRLDPRELCGRGTGLDDEGVARKAEVVARALAVNDLVGATPVRTLACVGGFEIAFLAGVALGCAAERVPIVLDGFITGTAALVAVRLAPAAAGAMIAGHRSAERGHAPVLEAVGLDPVLELDLRLGEGSGAALVLPLLASALALLRDMATFESAGVTDAGR
jgi:nicotinate-nucleotide--dimethylbenzimidazole phosphoribosyltransferase